MSPVISLSAPPHEGLTVATVSPGCNLFGFFNMLTPLLHNVMDYDYTNCIIEKHDV
ncbi:hypothetical protein OCA05_11920 [Bacillus cereus]|uniref:hypothetical protein n=1 Tax=Bacillus thuringiensis TaxID=1428 RepID=UPI0014830721|nr:hypothetical protein [Bacillus thuringiensis]MCU5240243.1 hypothetical protein [Bacillus cereus]MCU5240294.1 hypothetical protein [Bacillus cereus]MDY7520364.1 hypothetical protein [Bacillus thuringiensis]MEB8943077.1 hypothetical protein [Bacillus cereus]HDR4873133.1 hypothetical protein [Bacillus cereus]